MSGKYFSSIRTPWRVCVTCTNNFPFYWLSNDEGIGWMEMNDEWYRITSVCECECECECLCACECVYRVESGSENKVIGNQFRSYTMKNCFQLPNVIVREEVKLIIINVNPIW